MDSEELPSPDQEAESQSVEQVAAVPQTLDEAHLDPAGESPGASPPEPLSPTDPEPDPEPDPELDPGTGDMPSGQTAHAPEAQEPDSLDGECTEGDPSQPQEQSEPEDEATAQASWGDKSQPIDSMLADWSEDIEAFEMMGKDEL